MLKYETLVDFFIWKHMASSSERQFHLKYENSANGFKINIMHQFGVKKGPKICKASLLTNL